MSQKSQHTRYEEIILDRTCCEEAPQVVPACIWPIVTTSFKQQSRSLQLVDDVPLEQWRASALWSSCSKVWGWGGERQGKEGEGAGLPCGEEQGGCAACLELWVGVGDIIEKIVDSRYISIFSRYWQIIEIEKKYIWELSILKNVHLISSDKLNLKHCSQKQERDCFISQMNMKSSLKTVHKIARQ